jgi:hypothetical protein
MSGGRYPYADINYGCPHCQTPIEWDEFGEVSKVRVVSCGLTREEHIEVAKARAIAERQAHELLVQNRIDEQLPKAIIAAVYDDASRRVRGQQ